MIVVLADDLSGAAELAGAALQHGLTAEVQLQFNAASSADVVCVDTNTRSSSPDQAVFRISEIVKEVTASKPTWIYKKCDSVLRGNVAAEIRAILNGTGQHGAVMLSANPDRGRIIRDGEYFVNDVSLHRTAFASDPEHPRRSSRVRELLGTDSADIRTPDGTCTDDLAREAARVSASTLPAGGVEFFTALLRRMEPPAPVSNRIQSVSTDPVAVTKREPMLIVCGSDAAWRDGRRSQCEAHGFHVETMPAELLNDLRAHEARVAWAERISEALGARRRVLAAIGMEARHSSPSRLVVQFAAAVAGAIQRNPPAVVCAEGGATAAALAHAMNWKEFTVLQALAGGVVELQPVAVRAPRLIVKVGSYNWPDSIWER